MKLIYLANIRLPTEKAHGVQILKTCEALARAGVEVELVVTNRATPITEDPFAYYGVEKIFSITRLPVVDTVGWGRLGFYIESLSFAREVKRYIRGREGVIYGRDELILWRLKREVVWEAHTGAWNYAARVVAGRARKIVVISRALKDTYVARGIPAEKIVVAPDAASLDQFDIREDKAESRRALGLPEGERLAVYTGSRQPHKGTDVLERAVLPPGVRTLIVSGKPYGQMPRYLHAADVLILPNSGKAEVSRAFTSPMKLFEYMASGTPIVASDVPSIREVLDERAAYFFEPDNPESLSRAVKQALEDPEAPARARRAKELSRGYSWDARARRIIEAL